MTISCHPLIEECLVSFQQEPIFIWLKTAPAVKKGSKLRREKADFVIPNGVDLVLCFGRPGTIGSEGLDLVKLSCASGFEPWRIVEFECQVADEGGQRGGSVDF